MTNVIILLVAAAIVVPAVCYIHKQKKQGVKCIGCPSGCHCNGGCSGCNGSCHEH